MVAIVGRPNVGKSSLFNALAMNRTSIVEPTAGVTRDRVSAVCSFEDVYFELVDTGGFGIVDRDDLGEHVERQIRYALLAADLVLFVVDARDGLTPLDKETANLLRPFKKPVKILANKVDEPHMVENLGDLHGLGFGEPLAISAHSYIGLRELREFLESQFAKLPGPPPEPVMKIALVGKRNAGKSTFVNALAGEDRVIVSEIPGTTRDSVDVRFERGDRSLVAIDTAGVRKKTKMADDIEFFAYSRALDSVRRADVVLFLVDSTVPIGQVDKKLVELISGELKPCVFVVNKWDLAKGEASVEDYGDYLAKTLTELDYAPIAFTTATSGKNVDAAIDLAEALFRQSRTRVETGPLNRALREILEEHPLPSQRKRKRPKIFYATQISTAPPTIVLFVSDPTHVTQQQERFLLNRFRERLPYDEIPIRLVFRPKGGRSRDRGGS